jgi:hypothetical protein
VHAPEVLDEQVSGVARKNAAWKENDGPAEP